MGEYFNMQGIDKAALVNRIREWEAKGYEPVAPVAEIKTECKHFQYTDNRIKKNRYAGSTGGSIFKVRMRKVQ
ncbi:hypothetical protein [Alkalihalophilus pseudofirmus]|uniref:hypothetical protein n=1 Tax=Alkalihalophilus pseudofirmus TaxID=79885 RepID=UPI0011154703